MKSVTVDGDTGQSKRIFGIVGECMALLVLVFVLAAPQQSNAAPLTSPMLHNSDNLGTAKGVWGVDGGKYGRFTCGTCHLNDSTNIKRIRTAITAPQGAWSSSKTTSVAVSFLNETSYGSSDAHASSARICEACHSKTNVHRYQQIASPHNARSDCTSCHQHRDGFKQPNCSSCHNAPPTTGTHATHFAAGSASYGQTAILSTPSAYVFSCGICHNGTHQNDAANPATAEVVFAGMATGDPQSGSGIAAYTCGVNSVDNPGNGFAFNYSNGSCANTYCHGNYPGSGKKATPGWNDTASGACGTCHGASNDLTPTSGSHGRHSFATAYAFNCSLCHKDTVSGSVPAGYAISDKNKHVNGMVNWSFDQADPRIAATTSYSIPSGTAVSSDGTTPRAYGSCSNTYCHSNGTGGTNNSGETRAVAANSSPVWGGVAPCGSCHSWPPAYASGSPKGNSHNTHVAIEGMQCKSCHAITAAGATLDPTTHANGIYDVTPEAGYSFTYQYAADGGTCSNITCHGNRTWGSYGTATFLYFRSPVDLNNTMEPMPNAYLASGTYYGNTGYSTDSASPGRRVMTPFSGTTEESMVQTLNAAGNYRVAQFVSPRIAQSVSVANGSSFSIAIRNKKSSAFNTVKLRYTLYQWSAGDSQGTNFKTIAQDSVNISTTATNRTINFTNNAAVTFAPGDRIVCELEFNATGSSGTVTNSWGNWNSNAGLSLPVTLKFLTEN